MPCCYQVHQVNIGSTATQIVNKLNIQPNALLNKFVVVIANSKSGDFKGVQTSGRMLICVDKNNQKSIIVPPASSLVGEVVGFEGINGPPQFDDVLSGKRLTAIQKSFVSNSSGLVQCQGITLSCKAGPIVASGPDLKIEV